MLTAMEIPETAGPWLVLGVVLGVLVPVLAALAVGLPGRRRQPGPPPVEADEPARDDLPGFLDSPPGSVPAPAVPVTAWPALSPPPAPPGPAAPDRPDGGDGLRLLVAMGVSALLLVGAAAAVAAAGASDRTGDAAADDRAPGPPAPGDVAADLTFGGLVLDRQAVGVTVTYPRVLVGSDRGRTTAELELPTFNCLRDTAPVDPVAAGCTRSVTESAALSEPDLTVRTDDGDLLVTGSFATSRRRNGLPPVPTGRVLEVVVDVAPEAGRSAADGTAATGSLELGDDRAETTDDGPNEVRYGG